MVPVTEPAPHLRATADAYDALAVLYSDFARDALAGLPLDRSFIAAFAELARATGSSGSAYVAELGCGPGHVTDHLRRLGLDAFGIDLSPELIGLARQEYPGMRFDVGSMDALDLADGVLDGVMSWYSVIHAPPEHVPAYLAEFRRVLTAGGALLVAFFESGGGPVEAFDHKVTTAYRWPLDDLAALAGAAGFEEVGRMLREPCEGERFRRGHLLMRAR